MSLAEWLAPLNAPLVAIAGTSISVAESAGFVTGAGCVYLVARQSLWNWPIGIANNLFFILLFVTAGLYADAGLQVVFILLSVYGWWSWLYGGAQHDELAVTKTPTRTIYALAGATVLGTAALTALLAYTTPSTVPFWDGLTTVLSLVATYGQCRKQLECWYVWIAADILYVPLYASKGLYLTAILYVGFMALCVVGLRGWRRAMAGPVPAPLVSVT